MKPSAFPPFPDLQSSCDCSFAYEEQVRNQTWLLSVTPSLSSLLPRGAVSSIPKNKHTQDYRSRARPSSFLFVGKDYWVGSVQDEWVLLRSRRRSDNPGLDCVFQVWCMSVKWHVQPAEAFGESELESWWVKNCDLSLIIHLLHPVFLIHPLLILIFPPSNFLKLKKPISVFSDVSVFLRLSLVQKEASKL